MSNTQNFNSLLRYIKRRLGVPINLLELTDDDIYDIIVEEVLPDISSYIGKLSWIRLTTENLVTPNDHDNEYTFQIPIPSGEILVDVLHTYHSRDNVGYLGSLSGAISYYDPRDTVMMNSFVDMLKSLDVIQTFQFLPPNKIAFDMPIQSDLIIECKMEHSDLSTIPADIYRDIVKPLSLAEVMEVVVANRRKYESVTTPFGPLNLDFQSMKDDAQTIKQGVQAKLESLPPDVFIAFIDT